jgi:hypothetical protein
VTASLPLPELEIVTVGAADGPVSMKGFDAIPRVPVRRRLSPL